MSQIINGYKIVEGVFESGSATLPSVRNIAGLTSGLYFPSSTSVGVSVSGVQTGLWNAGGYRSILGSAATPSIAETGGVTGVYWPTAISLGFSVSGVARAILDATVLDLRTSVLLNNGAGATVNSINLISSAAGAVDGSLNLAASGVGSTTAAHGPFILLRGNSYAADTTQKGTVFLLAGYPTTPTSTQGNMRIHTGVLSEHGFTIGNTGTLDYKISSVSYLSMATTGKILMGVGTPAVAAGTRGVAHFVDNSSNATVSYENISTTGYAGFEFFDATATKQATCVWSNSDPGNFLPSSLWLGTRTAAAMHFVINTAVKMSIDSAGLVGINTKANSIAHGDLLHIYNTGTTYAGIQLHRNANTSIAAFRFMTGASTNDFLLGMRSTSDSDFHLYSYGTSSDALVVTRTTRNLCIGAAAAGATAVGVLALSNSATAPTTSVDLVQLYGVDLSAGNATLGLHTERAVAVDAAVVSTHTLTVKINGTNYRIMLAT